ncbi:MAG TPA: UDP-N-acetylmuramoyl-L-alanine--D-glutamate ligase [Burkholderiales bacterium]|nr:UDP-N-acetylmuramoyl-L-alanine--D-glutamate ligase [Burkholderiales bacterium]
MMREPIFSLLPTPTPAPLAGKRLLVLGLGDTGLSLARFAAREGAAVRVADTRADPPRRAAFDGEFHPGAFDASLLDRTDLLAISPGLPLDSDIVRAALERRIPVLGDVELFAWHNRAPVLAVTGTNGKSTVTALAAHLLRSAGLDAEAAGNIGPPVLDALMRRATPPGAWVLELSSYQLETTWSLVPRAAAMLNLSEDHLDRYAGLHEYGAAKARIFLGPGVQVLNRDDPRSLALARPGRGVVTFGTDVPRAAAHFGIAAGALVRGDEKIIDAASLPIHGMHNAANALAACALAGVLGLSLRQMSLGLASFKGLSHRLELVATRQGVDWYDDSKGTNVGATLAALRGLGRKTVLILGGEGKGQDFTPLAGPVRRHAAHVLLIGRDAPLIERSLAGVASERCASLEAAVQRAAALARPGQAVLLSPACASFDMFRDYKHRGEVFAAAVRSLPPGEGSAP